MDSAVLVSAHEPSSPLFWLRPAGTPQGIEERQRLAMGSVGPFLERLFLSTKIKGADAVPAQRIGEAWRQVFRDHAGREIMQGENAWVALSECCRIYHFDSALSAAAEVFPQAKDVLSHGYIRARLGESQLGLQVFLPWNNTYATWPL